MELQTNAKFGATRQSWSRTSIRQLYAECKAANPKVGHDRLVQIMIERAEEERELMVAAFDYIATNMETSEQGYDRRQREYTPRDPVAERKKEVGASAESALTQIALNHRMLNGKRLRYCIGDTEVVPEGKGLVRLGKKVGRKMVGEACDEKQTRELLGIKLPEE